MGQKYNQSTLSILKQDYNEVRWSVDCLEQIRKSDAAKPNINCKVKTQEDPATAVTVDELEGHAGVGNQHVLIRSC